MTDLRRTFVRASTLAVSATLVGACAAVTPVDPAARDADNPRLLLKIADRAADGATVARLAATAAGVPAEHLAASGGGWHAVRLRCTGAACDTALARLRQSAERPGPIEAVEADARKRPT